MLSASARKSTLASANKKSKGAPATASAAMAAAAACNLSQGGGSSLGADVAGRTLGRGSGTTAMAPRYPISRSLSNSTTMPPISIGTSGGGAFPGAVTAPSSSNSGLLGFHSPLHHLLLGGIRPTLIQLLLRLCAQQLGIHLVKFLAGSTVEDFLAEDEIVEEFIREIRDELKADIDGESSTIPRRRQSGPRRYIPRNREKGHDDLVANYFSANPIYTDEMFRRRFRMTRPLFLRIVDSLRGWSPYFTQRFDATGRDSLSPLQKCTAAIRMLAYGSSADQLDEVLKIAASTCLEILEKFAEGVIECFGEEYLRPPRSDEMEKILQENEARGFPGMLGSIDCMHWAWKNCPKGWAGMFTRGDKGIPTMILEAVATHDLGIWHAFFGTAGSQNDIKVLNKSPLFIQAIKGEAPIVQYYVNGTQYDMGYYLADKIYPEWAVFVKTVTAPQSAENKLFALKQEGARKDIECAFGVLQSRFDIVRRPAKLWKQADVINIMQACVILHNMIVEDEKE